MQKDGQRSHSGPEMVKQNLADSWSFGDGAGEEDRQHLASPSPVTLSEASQLHSRAQSERQKIPADLTSKATGMYHQS